MPEGVSRAFYCILAIWYGNCSCTRAFLVVEWGHMNLAATPRAWVEVEVDAIAHNLRIASRAAAGARLMPIVKANAYGHGLEAVARRLDAEGIAFFGVANVGEARRLEQAGVRTRPFVLGPTLPEEREEILLHGWGCTISTLAEAQHCQSLAEAHGREFPVHMALDTGMGREGFLPGQLGAAVDALRQLPMVRVEGAMSHYSAADEMPDFTREQLRVFAECTAHLRQCFPLQYCHIAASAGELGYSIPPADLVRPGIVIYGVSPIHAPAEAELRRALRLLSRVVLVRELPAGHSVSYGRTYTTTRPTRVATIGIGYADGWPRHLSGSGATVCIRGQLCPILGRVTMDLLMADVSAVPAAAVGDEVELIGSHQPVEQVAAWAGTIPWEIFTGLGVRLPRIYR